MGARPPERHSGQLTLEGLIPELAAPWLRQASRAHLVVGALRRRLDAGDADAAADLKRALGWRACCEHHALAHGADPGQLPAGESQC
jgi:hypothetical protein